MRVLFVATNLPIPATNGQAIRTLSIIRALASCGHEVEFASFSSPTPVHTFDPLSAWCHHLEIVEETKAGMVQGAQYLRRVRCLLSRKPYSVERFRSSKMQSRLGSMLAKDEIDLIVADGIYGLVNIPGTEVPIAINCHNVEHLIVTRYAGMQRNPIKQWYANAEADRVLEAERSACKRVSVAMVCSTTDRHLLQRFNPNLPIFVVPNSVNTDFYAASPESGSGENGLTLLFQGSMDWYPNCDAVEFFVESIFPLVLQEFPEAKFVVAGRNPALSFVKKFSRPGRIEFTGTVPDMRPYLSSAALVVVPLRLGSGTRIKILEASAANRATVSTSIGAEGLDFRPNQEIILADTPADFANEVIRLIRNPKRRSSIALSAQARVVESYSQTAINSSIKEVVSHIAEVRDHLSPSEVGS